MARARSTYFNIPACPNITPSRSAVGSELGDETIDIPRDCEPEGACHAATASLRTISASFVVRFIQRLYYMRLIKSLWRDLFQRSIPTIQSALSSSGLADVVWDCVLQPYRLISTQMAHVVAKLKQVVYSHIVASTHVSPWIVDYFRHRMLVERLVMPWATELLDAFEFDSALADRLTAMGLTNASVVSGMLDEEDATALQPLEPLQVASVATTLAERRRDLLRKIKWAMIGCVLYEDRLISALVRCLVQRLLEEDAISNLEHASWLTDANLARITLHLQQQGCTNDGLCWFVLNESLDLRKTQLAQTIRRLLNQPQATCDDRAPTIVITF